MGSKSKLDPERKAWWVENWKHIRKLVAKYRSKVWNVLNTKGISEAEEYLWQAILAKEGLGVDQGLGRNVYVGSDRELNVVRSNPKILSSDGEHHNNHWVTIQVSEDENEEI